VAYGRKVNLYIYTYIFISLFVYILIYIYTYIYLFLYLYYIYIYILHEISKQKANWIGHILRRNCLLQGVIEGKIKGGIEVTGRRGRRRRKLLDDLKERGGYSRSHYVESWLWKRLWTCRKTDCYSGADKSLARAGRKQAREHIGDRRDFNNIETRAIIKFFFLQGKAPKEIHAILPETLASFLPGRAKDLSAPLSMNEYI